MVMWKLPYEGANLGVIGESDQTRGQINQNWKARQERCKLCALYHNPIVMVYQWTTRSASPPVCAALPSLKRPEGCSPPAAQKRLSVVFCRQELGIGWGGSPRHCTWHPPFLKPLSLTHSWHLRLLLNFLVLHLCLVHNSVQDTPMALGVGGMGSAC